MFLSAGRLLSARKVPLGPGDPYFNNVSLLLPFDSLPFTDIKGHTVNNGSTTLTTTSTKFAGAAVFNGVDSRLEVPGAADLAMGAGDFTQEAWIKISAYPASQCIVWTNAPQTGTGFRATTLGLNLMSGGNVRVQSSYDVFLTGVATIPLNTWTHVAFARQGTTMRLFINGVIDTSGTVSNNYTDTTEFLVGKAANTGTDTGDTLTGQIEELRVTKGIARYTTNFSVPTAPFPTFSSDPNFANVTVLMHFDGGNGSTVFTNNGSAPTFSSFGGIAQSTTQVKFGSSSVFFPGTSANLSAAFDSRFDVMAVDYTVEAQVYLTALPGGSFAGAQGVATIYGIGNNTGVNGNACLWGIFSSTQLVCAINNGNTYGYFTGSALSTNTWYHIAFVRSGNTITAYVNGVQYGSSITDASTATFNNQVFIGSYADSYGKLQGYIDELRVTKGYARYLTSFSPPTYAFPDH